MTGRRWGPTWPIWVWVLGLLLSEACSGASIEAAAHDASPEEGCTASKQVELGAAQAFWEEVRRHGLDLKIRRSTVEEPAQPGRAARNRTAMVLVDDVFYGRAIMKIPRHALLSIETAPDAKLRRELNKFLFEDNLLQKRYNITSEDSLHLLSLAYPLIAENRNDQSVFRQWLNATRDVKLPVLELTPRQQRILRGTTVEGSFEEMTRNVDFILATAANLTYFHSAAVSRAEAKWALAVIMRHARVVHPHQDVRDSRDPRMYLVPLPELLDVHLHPDPGVAIPFQEEITLIGKREEEMVLQIARRDMAKGEEVFFWPGRMSNSEMVVRHGISFPSNPVGIGRNASQPPNWSLDKEAHIRKEYDKYNCSSLEAFELRFNPRGYPMRSFVRCYRVSWFLTNGWYTPALTGRLRELNKWPPPKQYGKDDWLAWTQADAEVNRVVHDYCRMMRQQLKDTMDSATAEDFRKSTDEMDRILWRMRSEESRTFKECIALAKTVGMR